MSDSSTSLHNAEPVGQPFTSVPRLSVEGMSVTYRGGAVGCSEVSFAVSPGSVLAVLGRNGVGKTSLLRGIAGFQSTEGVDVRGAVSLDGAPLPKNPVSVNRAGVAFVPEREKIFPSLTVAEHLKITGVTELADIEPLRFPALQDRWSARAGLLSGGERQMLALAMTWAQRPSVLLVDELSLGLAPIVVKQLLRSIREIVEGYGVSAVVVEQDAVAALSVADQVVILDHGEVVWSGDRSETNAAEVGARYLGLGAE